MGSFSSRGILTFGGPGRQVVPYPIEPVNGLNHFEVGGIGSCLNRILHEIRHFHVWSNVGFISAVWMRQPYVDRWQPWLPTCNVYMYMQLGFIAASNV